jgi:hypothetical protein
MDARERLAKLIAAVKSLQRRLSTIDEELDDVVAELMDVVELLGGTALRSVPRRVPSREAQILKEQAESGIDSVDLSRRSNWTELCINRGRPIRLTHRLGDLVQILIAERAGTDALVGWKPFDEVGAALGGSGRLPLRRQAIIQLVYRLRARLRESNENPFLVQLRKGTGIRFALRRHESVAREGNAPQGVTFGDDARSQVFSMPGAAANQGREETQHSDRETERNSEPRLR